MDAKRPKIGYWWSEKKSQKLNVHEFKRLMDQSGHDLVKLDFDIPFDEQGPFKAIVHKLSDVMVKADQGEEDAQRIVSAFEYYVANNPEMPVFDSLNSIRLLMDRYRQYKLINESELGCDDGAFTPSFVEFTCRNKSINLEKLKNSGVHFPFVCKPLVAHGSSLAHQMSLIFCEDGLNDINPPCVAQSFINHDARLYKLFVIKDNYFIIERPSLKNFRAGNYPTVEFDSSDISKPHSSSFLTELDKEDKVLNPLKPEKERLDKIVSVLRSHLGSTLFGLDLIIENGTGRYAIIDMNAFPGYDGVDNFLSLLRDLVINGSAINESGDTICSSAKIDNPEMLTSIKSPQPIQRSGTSEQAINKLGLDIPNNDIDSGIDTSDSCDEKKNKPLPPKTVRRQHSKNINQNNI